jgi:hypothetical protein
MKPGLDVFLRVELLGDWRFRGLSRIPGLWTLKFNEFRELSKDFGIHPGWILSQYLKAAIRDMHESTSGRCD